MSQVRSLDGSAVHERASSPRRLSSGDGARYRELEQKLAGLQKDYAELQTGFFDAAQVHRRLCPPRLVRRGQFEIASEIFPVRYLSGDFFTLEEAGGDVIFGLGDICG